MDRGGIFKNKKECPVAVVMCCSDYYAPYVSVTVRSILSCLSPERSYELIILTKDMTELNRKTLERMLTGYGNVRLRFLDMAHHIKGLQLITQYHFTVESYFRSFIPYVLSEYDRVIYCDSDLVWLRDPAALFDMDLGSNLIAAVIDPIYIYQKSMEGAYWEGRNERELGISVDTPYVNTGVMLWNLGGFREVFSQKYTIQIGVDHQFMFCDQDVLNILCEGAVHFLEPNWNVLADTMGRNAQINETLGDDNAYKSARSSPWVIHWADQKKPWNTEGLDFESVFWRFARQSPFYEHMFYRLSRELFQFHMSQRGYTAALEGMS